VVLVLAAGAVHLAQVGVHFDEGWPIAAFFLVAGICQVTGAALLLQPRPSAWFWLGIAGSAALISLWVVSRTIGVPFVGAGVEPIGVADGFASVVEAWTILILGLHLAEPVQGWRTLTFALGAALVLALAIAWYAAAAAGVFNGDPARFTAPLPSVLDSLIVAGGVALAASLLMASRVQLRERWLRGLMRGLIATVALTAFGGVWLTLPPTIGQNLACRYAPLSTILTGGHSPERDPVTINDGDQWIVPVFELRACAIGGEVVLEGVEPLTTLGEGATVDSFWLLPPGVEVTADGQGELPGESRAVPPGGNIVAGKPRQLVVRLVGTGAGEYILGSVTLSYRTDELGSFTFATQIAVCSGGCPGP
jgi:hypothetical protein